MSSVTDAFLHRLVPAPAGNDGPTLLLLHGTGGDENDMIPLGRDLSPEAALLSLRGNVLENGAPRFFRRFAEGVFDESDIRRRSDELAQFIEGAAERYALDRSRIVAVGYSNGANIASATMLLHPGAVESAILIRPMVVIEPKPLPDLTACSVLISSGISDPIAPAAHIDRLEAIFREAGAAVEVRRQSASHSLIPADISDARAWLRKLNEKTN